MIAYFIPLASVYFAYLSGIPQYWKWWYNNVWHKNGKLERLKPLDCSGCLTFWLSVIFHAYYKYNIPEIILYSMGLAFFGAVIEQIIERIRR